MNASLSIDSLSSIAKVESSFLHLTENVRQGLYFGVVEGYLSVFDHDRDTLDPLFPPVGGQIVGRGARRRIGQRCQFQRSFDDRFLGQQSFRNRLGTSWAADFERATDRSHD